MTPPTLSHTPRSTYLGLITVDQLQNCSLEHFPRLLVYVEAVAVVRPEYCCQSQLQDASISVDSEEVGQREVSLLSGDLSVLRPVQLAPPAPAEDILWPGPGEHPLVGQVAVRLLQGRAAVAHILSSEQSSSLSDEV